jgi:hypothetical protein
MSEHYREEKDDRGRNPTTRVPDRDRLDLVGPNR